MEYSRDANAQYRGSWRCEERNAKWMGDEWKEKGKYMTKKQWTGEVTEIVARASTHRTGRTA
jgi:hypothetical protein